MNYKAVNKILKDEALKRPILGVINYKNGVTTVCNSYIIVREVNKELKAKELPEFNLSATTLLPVYKGEYPNKTLDIAIAAIKDKIEVLQENVTIISKDTKFYYNIQEKLFEKSKIDFALACLNRKMFGTKVQGKMFVANNGLYFVYEDIDMFALVLGTRDTSHAS